MRNPTQPGRSTAENNQPQAEWVKVAGGQTAHHADHELDIYPAKEHDATAHPTGYSFTVRRDMNSPILFAGWRPTIRHAKIAAELTAQNLATKE